MKKPRTIFNKPIPRKSQRKPALPPCDKWIIGMVEMAPGGYDIKMFPKPKIHTTYDSAAKECKRLASKHDKAFVVFAKKLVIGPSRPPFIATEFSA